MMIDATFQGLTACACAVVAWRAENAINHMTRCTHALVRWTFLLLAAAGVGGVLAILLAYVPGWLEVLMSCGGAGLTLCERRIRLLSNVAYRREAAP